MRLFLGWFVCCFIGHRKTGYPCARCGISNIGHAVMGSFHDYMMSLGYEHPVFRWKRGVQYLTDAGAAASVARDFMVCYEGPEPEP